MLVDKFAVGLFGNPYAERDITRITSIAMEGQEPSRRLADESITVLKNDVILPLTKGISAAVIGSNADSAMVNFVVHTYPGQLDMTKGMATGESRMASASTMKSRTAVGGSCALGRYFADRVEVRTRSSGRNSRWRGVLRPERIRSMSRSIAARPTASPNWVTVVSEISGWPAIGISS